MKKYSLIAIFAVAGLAPLLQGCNCEDVLKAEKDIMGIYNRMVDANSDPERWRAACNDIRRISIQLPSHQALLGHWIDEKCGSGSRDERCSYARDAKRAIADLRRNSIDLCDMIRKGADPRDQIEPINIRFRKIQAETLKQVEDLIIPGGDLVLKDKCGKDQDFDGIIPGEQDAVLPNKKPGAYNGNSRRPEEDVSAPENKSETGSAGGAIYL